MGSSIRLSVREGKWPAAKRVKVMDSLSIATVGCGSFGRHMADLLERLPGLNITAVCDPDAEKSLPLARELGVPAYASFQRCLEESEATSVALFTPNHLHAPMAIAAAEAGKHIFCEKPMAMNVAECYAMIEAAESNGVKLMVGHKRRLRPQYVKMAEIVRGQRYGRPLAVQVNGFYGRELWDWWTRRETGGGLLFHAGVHDLDFLRHACGEVGTVFARSPVKTDHGTDFEDALALLIQFESGTVATLQVSPFSPQRTFRQAFGVHFVLERGDLIYDPAETTVTVQGRGEPPQQFRFDNQAGFEQAYRIELESFAAWVSRDAEPVLTGWDGLRCVEIMEAAQLSAYSGRQVQLPLPRVQARQEWLGTPASTREMAEPTLFARGLSMAEGPAFDRQGHLFVANCRARHLSRISPGGEVSHFLSTGGKPQGVVVAPDERLFISDNQKRMIFRADAGGRLEEFCGRYRDGSRLRGPNEIALGPDGRIYFTDPGRAWRGRPQGALSRVDGTGRAELLAEGLEFTNGLDFTPDGREIYVVETTTGKVLRAALAGDGTLAEPLREFVRFEGSVGPDGIRFAASGNLYVTLFGRGQVAVVSPEGKVIDRLRVPGLFPTNVIFAGRSLLVCEGQTGAIWKLEVGEEGVPTYSQRIWQKP